MDDALLDSSGKYIDPEQEQAYQDIKTLITIGKTGVNNPVAIVLGGQPGAGKKNIYAYANERFDGNIVAIDCDDFRVFHPQSEIFADDPDTYGINTNPFVFSAVDRLIEELSPHSFNMIIESTMKNTDASFQDYELLTPRGYTIEACIMATPRDVSWQSTIDRYEEMKRRGEQARKVPQNVHDEAVEGIADAADEIYRSHKMANMQIFNRNGIILYDMKETPRISPKAILEEHIRRSEIGGENMSTEERDTLIEAARHADLAEYFRSSGYTTRKESGEIYVDEFKGLCINPDSNSWFSHYDGIGRVNNSIDCLTMIVGKSFKEAVYELTGRDLSLIHTTDHTKKSKTTVPIRTERPKEETKPSSITMPQHADNQRRLFAYLHSSRKIPNEIIREFVEAKVLYQSEKEIQGTLQGKPQTFKKANAVFVHKDKDGRAIGGEIQGLDSTKRFKGVVTGTGESCFRFVPDPSKKPVKAFVFESAIDLMSFYSMSDKTKLSGMMFVSMAGLKPFVVKQLRDEGLTVLSGVDNDEAGRKFEEQNGLERSQWVKEKLDIHGFKDWNERLVHQNDDPSFLINEPEIIKEFRAFAEEHGNDLEEGTNIAEMFRHGIEPEEENLGGMRR